MKQRIPKLYTPVEMRAVLEALGRVIEGTLRDPAAIVTALHKLGYRIVYVGKIDE